MRRWDLVKYILIGIGILGILGYAIFEARGLIAGPLIEVGYPSSGDTLHERVVTLTGRTERVSRIALNGKDIFISEDGTFEEPLILLAGYNETTIEAWGRFGEHTSQTLQNYFIPTWYDGPINNE